MRLFVCTACAVLLLAATPARADEPWRRHAVGDASVALPSTYEVRTDRRGWHLAAADPEDATVEVHLQGVSLSDFVLEGTDAKRTRDFAAVHLAAVLPRVVRWDVERCSVEQRFLPMRSSGVRTLLQGPAR